MLYAIFQAIYRVLIRHPSPQDEFLEKQKKDLAKLNSARLEAQGNVLYHKDKAIYHRKMAEYSNELLSLPELKKE